MDAFKPLGAHDFDRRFFLKGIGAVAAGSMLPHGFAIAQGAAPLLKVATRTLEVNRKAAKVFGILGPGERPGLLARAGERFKGAVFNDTGEPLQLHWHGQVLAPSDQDRARPGGGMLASGQSDFHDFELTPGTHWMHSHTLSEQQLLAAPMVTLEADNSDVQDIVIMLHDFAFRSPQEILAELGGTDAHASHGAAPAVPAAGQASARQDHMNHGAHSPHHATGHGAGHGGGHGGGRGGGHGPGHGGGHGAGHGAGHGGGHGHMMGMTHANDVRYDAYLANDRTLDDPEIVKVEKGGRVRLRIINGATASSFLISTPGLVTQVVAVDGVPCRRLSATSYPIAQGQRLDLVAEIPKAGGAFPVLAQVEDAEFLTGVVLASQGAAITKRASTAKQKAAMADLSLDLRLTAVTPLKDKRPDRAFSLMLGEEAGYRWTINGRVHGEHVPFEVRQGERVEMTFMNPTGMMHPMHLHGHKFQVVGIGRRRYSGPMRDTVIVPPHMPVTVAFDAGLKGAWFLHCHHLYHMATGMMTEVIVS